jgi:hypothetical protein
VLEARQETASSARLLLHDEHRAKDVTALSRRMREHRVILELYINGQHAVPADIPPVHVIAG